MATAEIILKDRTAHRLLAGDLEALILPGRGMLCASLLHRGAELLRRVDDLDAAAGKGSTAGIPLLHPWANRLESTIYRVAAREVTLDPNSPLLHLDENRLPIHGVPWALLEWEVVSTTPQSLAARLDWNRSDLLAVFPFRHQLELQATLDADGLMLSTTLIADARERVPVSFGFHPYFGIPDLPRSQWRLTMPAMQRLTLDARGIPTGERRPIPAFDAPLKDLQFDDGFALADEHAAFSISGAGRRITTEFLAGYRFAQIYAPEGKDLVALEPMTAPTNALASGRDLQLVEPGGRFQAAFRVRIETIA